MSWLDRLRGGFSKTAERVADNLTGLTSRAALDTATLDDIEEALIASDLGPEASHRIREAIAQQRFEKLDERRSEEHTSELQSRRDLVCRLLLEKKKKK